MIKTLFACILALHSVIHLMGFAKAFGLAEIKELTQNISKSAGVLWLISAILFFTAAVLCLFYHYTWWIIGFPALLFSQILIVLYWKDAKFGTLVNIIILTAVIVNFGTWHFNRTVSNELKELIPCIQGDSKIITEETISALPQVIAKWLRRSDVIGKEKIETVSLTQTGVLRTKTDGPWMPIRAEQWFNVEKPGFIWFAKIKALPGIHLFARDRYLNGMGHMLIKLLSLFPIADAKGSDIDQGTLLRYLAETIWFPTAALHDYLQWEQIDTTSAKATMTVGDVSASGEFYFNQNGDFLRFEAERFYYKKEGSTLEDWLIQADTESYTEFEGIRIPARSSVTWRLQEGEFNWLKLEVIEIHYNRTIN